ncbi:phage virion morphogenesis protein [Elizabethkingia meningoseptica]|uniref:phage virion morphogenesis protein n=1 Tax=Elizabethkingia meningoseptica TaxID=238 RepID=UPI0023B0D13D|nr:phage virion morphogenesis protein [Elizabethkingia meningoseptica]MDE5525683.1 phage virion morphogenesis protein [Elizabethkingia meningoseptica]
MSLKLQTDFFKKLSKVQNPAFLTRMVGQAGVIAVNFSKERFVQKNWLNESAETWQPRKRPGKGSLMTVSGRLKRSIRKVKQGSYYVYIGTDVPYAQIHNEGGEINKTVTVRAHSRQRKNGRQNVRTHTRKMNVKMPKRQFLGDSKTLARNIENHLSRMLDNEISNQ